MASNATWRLILVRVKHKNCKTPQIISRMLTTLPLKTSAVVFLTRMQRPIDLLSSYSIHKQRYVLWAVWSVKANTTTSAEAVFSLRRHATPRHRWRCLFCLSSSESKSPRGTKPEAYALCTGNKGESTPWVQWRGKASWTLMGLLSPEEITQTHTKKLHWNIEKSVLFLLQIHLFHIVKVLFLLSYRSHRQPETKDI